MHRLKRTKLLLAVVTVFAIGIVVAVFLFNNRSPQENPIPDSVEQQVDYTLYYPAKLSSDFHFDEIAFDEETKVVTYKYSSDEKSVFFSLQKKPEDLNYEEFRNTQMTGVREVKTPIGTAYAGTLQNQTIGSILTDTTWILMTAGPGTTIDDLEQASKSLERTQE